MTVASSWAAVGAAGTVTISATMQSPAVAFIIPAKLAQPTDLAQPALLIGSRSEPG